MTPDKLSSAVDQFYSAFQQSDLTLLARLVTADFILDLPILEHVALDAEYRGMDGFKKFLVDRSKARIDYTAFDEQHRMVDGFNVAVFGRTMGTAGERQRPFAHDWVHLFRFEGERIQLLKEYVDTSEVSMALAP
jgi:ketosteroid isomerase-like protein